MFDLTDLSCFVRVAETGSLTRAAINYDLSPSVLSRRLQNFEKEVGGRLFYRTGRGVKFTELGRHLLPRAKQLLVEARKLSDEVKAASGVVSGHVTVGLPGSVAALIAGPLFRTIREQYPMVSVRLVEGLSGVIEELLLSSRIDIGLFFTKRANVRRGDLSLCVTDLCLVGPAGDHLTAGKSVRLSAIAGHPLVLPGLPHALRAMIEDACAVAGVSIHVPYEVDSVSTMKEVVANGFGYTVSAYDVIARDVESGRLQATRIIGPPLTRLLVGVSAPKQPMTRAARVVQGTISNLVTQMIKEQRWSARLPQCITGK